ncbi:MAG: N-acetylmuramoyl-L-alanine amidase [Candidatus Eremiobacteraeota bacterium]|nr:N-acetylmuramoyl-L-alanine amidase [Candidatus Eremiobacteraeota bacterium]
MQRRVIRYGLLFFLLMLLCAEGAWCREGERATLFLMDKPHLLRNFFMVQGDRVVAAPAEKVPARTGKEYEETFSDLYLSLDDPDVKALFLAMGAFFTWSSSGDTLFIFSSGRNVYFDRNSSWSDYKGRSEKRPGGYIKQDGATYVNFAHLVALMHTSLRDAEKPSSFHLLPVIDDIYWKEDMGTRELLVHTSIPLKYKVDDTRKGCLAYHFPYADCSLSTGELQVADSKISIEAVPGEPLALKVTLFFPPSWEGRFTERRISGDMVAEMLPAFSLTPGYKFESVTKLEPNPPGRAPGFFIEATGPFQYDWNYYPAQKLLVIDMPLVELPKETKVPSPANSFVTASRVYSFSKLYGDVRFSFTLADRGDFSLVTDRKKNPHGMAIEFRQGTPGATAGRGVTGDAENWGTIVLDPGHGGGDPGAVNSAYGVLEKEVNLDLAMRLMRILQKSGWKVVLTRTSDRDVSWAYSPDRVELQARADVAAINGATIFISIHCNASTSSEMRGSSLHWCKDDDYPLATAMTEATALFESQLGIPQRGLIQNNFYVLRHSSMPALLIETAHISHADEALILADPSCRQRIAEAIAKGIEKYFLTQNIRKAP